MMRYGFQIRAQRGPDRPEMGKKSEEFFRSNSVHFAAQIWRPCDDEDGNVQQLIPKHLRFADAYIRSLTVECLSSANNIPLKKKKKIIILFAVCIRFLLF